MCESSEQLNVKF